MPGDDVEDVTDGDGSWLAVGLAEGKEEGWFDGALEVGVEGAVVKGVDGGEDGVAAADCDEANHLGGAGAAKASRSVDVGGFDDVVEVAAGCGEGGDALGVKEFVG